VRHCIDERTTACSWVGVVVVVGLRGDRVVCQGQYHCSAGAIGTAVIDHSNPASLRALRTLSGEVVVVVVGRGRHEARGVGRALERPPGWRRAICGWRRWQGDAKERRPGQHAPGQQDSNTRAAKPNPNTLNQTHQSAAAFCADLLHAAH